MEINISKTLLSNAIQKVGSSVAKNPTVDILSYVKFNVDQKQMRARATNMENECIEVIELEQEFGSKAFLIKFDVISKIIKTSKTKEISISIDSSDSEEDKITIMSGKASFKIRSPKAQNFPEIITTESMNEIISISSEDLLDAINKASFSISKNIERYNLTGLLIKIEVNNDDTAIIQCVSTDGHRLSLSKANGSSGKSSSILIPGKSISELKKLLKNKSNCTILIDDNNNKIQFKNENLIFATKLLDATFPDYNKVIPQNNDKIAEINKNELLDALANVRVINDLKGKGVKMEISKDKVVLTSKNNNEEKVEDQIPCSFLSNSDEHFIATYNPEFLEEPLRAIKSDKIRINLDSPNKPALISPLEDEGSEYVIMPMRNED